MKPRRPIKVHWFNPHWNEYFGRSFAYFGHALEFAMARAEEGCYEVLVWDADNGNIIYRVREPN